MGFDDVAARMRARHEGEPEPSRPPAFAGSDPSTDELVRQLQRDEKRSKAKADLVMGSLLLAGGLLISMLTHDSASQSGGTYIVAWGPMLYGVIRLIRGLMGIGG
ncbi:MAG: hypothetical protein H0T42_28860 [Deltaproteobacteria bacterium]|nr:hypothetical protein [Deltaproteobacteria bacterium]